MPQNSCPGKSAFLYHSPVGFRQGHSKISEVCFYLLVPVKQNLNRFVCELWASAWRWSVSEDPRSILEFNIWSVWSHNSVLHACRSQSKMSLTKWCSQPSWPALAPADTSDQQHAGKFTWSLQSTGFSRRPPTFGMFMRLQFCPQAGAKILSNCTASRKAGGGFGCSTAWEILQWLRKGKILPEETGKVLQAMKRDLSLQWWWERWKRDWWRSWNIRLAREGMRRLTPPNVRLHSEWYFAVNDLTRSTLWWNKCL